MDNMDYEKLSEIMKQVHARRLAGFNCAEGVFWGVSQILNLNTPVSCVTGFGGGVAGSGSVCGALCGAIAAAGVYSGRIDPEDKEAKLKCDSLCRKISREFVNEMGGTQLCREILGHMPGSKLKQPAEPGTINPKCEQAVRVAIEITVKAIKKDQCQNR